MAVRDASKAFTDTSQWVSNRVERALQVGESDTAVDVTLEPKFGETKTGEVSVNVRTQPSAAHEMTRSGCLMVFEDITSETRLRPTVFRYMPKEGWLTNSLKMVIKPLVVPFNQPRFY
ncbi:MAG: hypothetical protein VX589_16960 [Myxococcota bacterium]|nr:hypothetical protein [Myxococcota bacterium]